MSEQKLIPYIELSKTAQKKAIFKILEAYKHSEEEYQLLGNDVIANHFDFLQDKLGFEVLDLEFDYSNYQIKCDYEPSTSGKYCGSESNDFLQIYCTEDEYNLYAYIEDSLVNVINWDVYKYGRNTIEISFIENTSYAPSDIFEILYNFYKDEFKDYKIQNEKLKNDFNAFIEENKLEFVLSGDISEEDELESLYFRFIDDFLDYLSEKLSIHAKEIKDKLESEVSNLDEHLNSVDYIIENAIFDLFLCSEDGEKVVRKEDI